MRTKTYKRAFENYCNSIACVNCKYWRKVNYPSMKVEDFQIKCFEMYCEEIAQMKKIEKMLYAK